MKELTLGVRDFQAQLGLALRTAREGGRVVITSHNRPIAKLVAPDKPRRADDDLEAKLKVLVKKGLATPGYIGPMPKFRRLKFSNLAAQIEADRR